MCEHRYVDDSLCEKSSSVRVALIEKCAKIAEKYEPDEKLDDVTYASCEIRTLKKLPLHLTGGAVVRRWFVSYIKEHNICGYVIHETSADLNTTDGIEYMRGWLNRESGDGKCIIISWKELSA